MMIDQVSRWVEETKKVKIFAAYLPYCGCTDGKLLNQLFSLFPLLFFQWWCFRACLLSFVWSSCSLCHQPLNLFIQIRQIMFLTCLKIDCFGVFLSFRAHFLYVLPGLWSQRCNISQSCQISGFLDTSILMLFYLIKIFLS